MKQTSIINKFLVVELTFKAGQATKLCWNCTSKTINSKAQVCELKKKWIRLWSWCVY
jgi:hypothetical protein